MIFEKKVRSLTPCNVFVLKVTLYQAYKVSYVSSHMSENTVKDKCWKNFFFRVCLIKNA